MKRRVSALPCVRAARAPPRAARARSASPATNCVVADVEDAAARRRSSSAMRVAWRRRKVRSCEITTTPPRCAASVSSNQAIEGRSRWLVGSSSSSTSGAESSSFASSTRTSQPPEKDESGRSIASCGEADAGQRARRRAPRARSRRRTRTRCDSGRSARRARRAPPRRAAPRPPSAPRARAAPARARRGARAPTATSARRLTPRPGSISWRSRATRTPRGALTLPASGGSSPAAMRSSVVLPAPFGPISPMRSPARTSSVTSRNSVRAPWLRATPSSRSSMRSKRLEEVAAVDVEDAAAAPHLLARDEGLEHAAILGRVGEEALAALRGGRCAMPRSGAPSRS